MANEIISTHKGKIGGYSHKKLDARWAKLREEAEDRQHEHDSLTTQEKLDKAFKRVKNGMGECKREIVRLQKRLVDEKEAKKKAVETEKKGLTEKKTVVK